MLYSSLQQCQHNFADLKSKFHAMSTQHSSDHRKRTKLLYNKIDLDQTLFHLATLQTVVDSERDALSTCNGKNAKFGSSAHNNAIIVSFKSPLVLLFESVRQFPEGQVSKRQVA